MPTNGSSIVRNAGSKYVLPSENEWYKAAYYNPATKAYFQYATGTDAAPMAEAPPGGSNSANYNGAVGRLTDVDAYASTTSPNDALDMSGNAWEWDETLIHSSTT